MEITIHYDPALPRNIVEIHAWEKDGKLFHFPGERNPDGTFIFRLKQLTG